MRNQFSVLMSCYGGDNPKELEEAIDSVFKSTINPTELVLVMDGPLNTKLKEVIRSAVSKYPTIKQIPIDQNVGLGEALRIGLNNCTNNLVARMDSDDLNLPNRFEQQLNEFSKNKDLSVCGMQIEEFSNNDSRIFIRRVPKTQNEIIKFSKLRNPFNHVTVMLNKEHILKIGSYEPVPLFEDYFLWMKCLNANYQVINIDNVGVKVRAGLSMTSRRKGFSYTKKEIYFFQQLKNREYINRFEYILALSLRLPPRLLGKSLSNLYNQFLRTETKS